jgi:hypothetical protein
MDTNYIRATDLKDSLVETHTDVKEYQLTDSQESNTASIQCEFVSGISSALTL